MKMLKILAFLLTFSLVTSGPLFGTAWAQEPQVITIGLVADGQEFEPQNPIRMQVTVRNVSGRVLIAREGVEAENWEHDVIFTDPKDRPIRSGFLRVGDEPRAPFMYNGRWAVFAEEIPIAWENLRVFDARNYYELLALGPYIAEVHYNLETFWDCAREDPADPGSPCIADPITGKIIAYLDERVDSESGTLLSNKITFKIVPPPVTSVIEVGVMEHEKDGPNTPLYALINIFVKDAVIEKYGAAYFKNYERIWRDWNAGRFDAFNDTPAETDPNTGVAIFYDIPQNAYLIIAYCPDCPVPPKWDYRYMGSPVSYDDPNWFTERPLQKNFMVKYP